MNDLEKYFNLCKTIAKFSDYPTTKVGALFLKDNKIMTLGYNHLINLLLSDDLPKDSESDNLLEKRNTYTIHAEMDAILKYGGSLSDFKDASLIVTLFPCNECAKILIQLGISHIFYLEDYHREEICNAAKKLFTAGGVTYTKCFMEDN